MFGKGKQVSKDERAGALQAQEEAAYMLAALQRSQATIEFTLEGRILNANENFLRAMGYSLDEIRGQHHSMFCDPEYRQSHEYRAFWERLARGEFVADKFMRIGKGGREIWIQASYNPIMDGTGRPFKVVKFASDITEAEALGNEQRAKIEAIGRSQAVIEFKPDGTILHANENFLGATGYSLSEIVNKHHSLFLDAAQAGSSDYRAFWERLRRGEFVADKFRRVGKGGREIWIQASYNPLLDLKGRVFKVVKFAADVTAIEHERKAAEEERAARSAEQADVVTSLASGLRQLSEGNLTIRINNTFAKDYEQLRADFNDAMGKLQEAMKAIVVNSGGIRSGAGEISQASDDLSRRTEQQAASLEETAAALDEITATVRKTAEGAKQANNVVAATRSDAETSGQVVRETVSAMAEIEKSSKQISQIIGVIDEIAFQTNLLALNAGVEAARAGEAGRGFAVVASEVRALAQRSSEAAKEIKGLISASTQHVETGVELVGEAGKALQVIVGKVTEISGLVSEISASAQEQSTALVQVNTAINQMGPGSRSKTRRWSSNRPPPATRSPKKLTNSCISSAASKPALWSRLRLRSRNRLGTASRLLSSASAWRSSPRTVRRRSSRATATGKSSERSLSGEASSFFSISVRRRRCDPLSWPRAVLRLRLTAATSIAWEAFACRCCCRQEQLGRPMATSCVSVTPSPSMSEALRLMAATDLCEQGAA